MVQCSIFLQVTSTGFTNWMWEMAKREEPMMIPRSLAWGSENMELPFSRIRKIAEETSLGWGRAGVAFLA